MKEPAPLRIYVGYDRREDVAYRVACDSMRRHASRRLDIRPVGMAVPGVADLYWRTTERRGGLLWDTISGAPMSTEFAIARFLVPHLAGYKGIALFCDSDFLFRADVAELFALADPHFAVQVVKHCYVTGTGDRKMDGQINHPYPRKNWSSLILWNCGHPCNKVLTPEVVNLWAGRDLHRFSWLADDLVGSLSQEWNWLELEPKAVHFTLGCPDMPGHEHAAYADEWWSYAKIGADNPA